ncbi:MAG TPA: DedA family protein [Thermoflexus sp.]|nr:DedA family protein [Thermoflexus sp.]
MHQEIIEIQDWIESAVGRMGYAGIFLATVVEVVFPPLPSDLLVSAAGLAAAGGVLEPGGVIAAATAGTVVGSLILYAISRFSGEPAIRRWIQRYGRWLRIGEGELERSKRWFHRFGMPLVPFAHLIPGLRSLIAIPAGLSQFPLMLFLIGTTGGAAVRASLQTGAGLLLGWHGLSLFSSYGMWIVGAVLLLIGLWGIYASRAAERRR